MEKHVNKKPIIPICLVLLSVVLSVGFFQYGTALQIDQVNAASAASVKAAAKAGAKDAKSVDLANTLRKSTVQEVYDTKAIPAYSYDQIWNMDVSQPSGVTVADLKLVSRGAFVGLEEAFWKAEQDYGVNCLFVMGIASLESANGTMCYRPNNMFGFGGKSFSSKAECIDVVARALAYNYLSPSGSLYSGKRITDVNKRYAASSTWDEKVCRNMANYYSVISPNHNAQLTKIAQE